jgi:cytochrome P450
VTNVEAGPGSAAIGLPIAWLGVLDPPGQLTSLRDQRPVCRLRYPDGHVGWLVTSYELVRTILTDPRFDLDFARKPFGDPAHIAASYEVQRETGIMANLLPPRHTRWRQVLADHFTVSRANKFRPQIERIVDERLDAMAQAGPTSDIVEMLARPVALATHCAILGVPDIDGERFLGLAQAQFSPDSDPEDLRARYQTFCEFLAPLIEQKRRQPEDDLISALGESAMTNADIFGSVAFLFLAGVTTVGEMLALSVYSLLSNREQLAALRADPALPPDRAVDELLRYGMANQAIVMRRALEDVELDGVVIKPGETITVSVPAANRDPNRFPDPDRLELTRSNARGHFTFGSGRHKCLGQHMGRVELEVALVRLAQRFPTLQLAVPAPEVRAYTRDRANLGIYELPVAW